MIVVSEIEAARQAVRHVQRQRRTVGLVPTMGALHAGHLSLVHAAAGRCDSVAVTIFVNPTQFGPSEDFQQYPRPLETDLAACESAGVDLVFAPTVETMYPRDSLTEVTVGRITEILCGPGRPGHFTGVATVCAKLFNILPADVAFFGEKDYQQLAVIRRMVRDLNMPIEIVGCPTVREPDGMALSSRNQYLSPDERKQATSLSRALFKAVGRIAAGERQVNAVADEIRSEILATGPAEIEYVDIVDAVTLELLTAVDRPARICLAVRIGSCRLIDNVAVDPPSEAG
jgi:pantoate--beta-alanine ligase